MGRMLTISRRVHFKLFLFEQFRIPILIQHNVFCTQDIQQQVSDSKVAIEASRAEVVLLKREVAKLRGELQQLRGEKGTEAENEVS